MSEPQPLQFFEDLAVGTSESFGRTEVSREEVVAFAARFDPQPFHLSDEAAAETFFGRLSASGWHTAAMTMAMMVAHQQDQGHQGSGSPGIDELRFVRPVYPGDVLTVRRTLLEKRRSASRPELGIFRSRIETLNQNGDLVLSFVGNAFVRVRDPSAPV